MRHAAASTLAVLLAAACLAQPPAADTEGVSTTDVTTVQDLARIQGQGESVLRGVGIVTGLKGTGDSAADLALARPLAQIYSQNGNPLPDLRELSKGKSAALVALECVIPPEGARRDDAFDVHVTVMHSATSLQGGRLFLAPLSGPFPGDPVYAMATGSIVLEDPANPTAGRVRVGARMLQDVLMPAIRDSFVLVVNPNFRGYTVTDQLAEAVNGLAPEPDVAAGSAEAEATSSLIAYPIDDVTVRVEIPAPERRNPAKFVARVMSTQFSPSLLKLPAQVVVNQRTGSIIVTGDVEISAVAVSHKDLVITTTAPPPVPSPANPILSTARATSVQTTTRPSDRARIGDLLQVFKQLDVPVQDQISILTQIHRAGRLHARLVIE